MPGSSDFDLVVIGAGIHGASIALEAGRSGYRVLLIEQYDRPARGTSSRSSKLIHGGLRYLESMELGLVYECLADRRRLLSKYPDLVKLQRFHIPVYRDTSRSRLLIRTGLSLYALLGGLKKDNLFHSLDRSEWELLDGLDTRELLAVYQYYDAQTDDARLTERLIMEAGGKGVQTIFNSRFTNCVTDGESVTVKYDQDGSSHSVGARYLINAAGPWVNRVASLCNPAVRQLEIDLVQGVHIELPGELRRGIYYLESPKDRRAVFAMPWHGHILVGTTETLYTGDPADTSPAPAEIDYLLNVFNHYFKKKRGETGREEVIDSWSGLRVLPKSSANPFKRTRETIFVPNEGMNSGIYSIYGGKLTSHYSTAVKLLRLLNQA